jgi:hypothetical protein
MKTEIQPHEAKFLPDIGAVRNEGDDAHLPTDEMTVTPHGGDLAHHAPQCAGRTMPPRGGKTRLGSAGRCRLVERWRQGVLRT